MLRLEHISWNTPEGTKVLDDLSLTAPDGKLTVDHRSQRRRQDHPGQDHRRASRSPTPAGSCLDGEDITDLDVTERARQGVSYAFQQPVRFKGTHRAPAGGAGRGRTLWTRRPLCAVLSRVGLCAREYIDREVNATLSGGEIKRIEIATVLAAAHPACPSLTNRKRASTCGASPISSTYFRKCARSLKGTHADHFPSGADFENRRRNRRGGRGQGLSPGRRFGCTGRSAGAVPPWRKIA